MQMQLQYSKMRLCSAIFFLYLEINIILAGVTSPSRIRKDTARQSCISSNFQLEHCVPMDECESLKNLESNSSHADDNPDKEFLQQFRCSPENEDLKVCCPTFQENMNARFLYKLFGKRKHATKSKGNQPKIAPKQPTPLSKFPTHCGDSTLAIQNVMDGLPAKLGDFPWLVALYYNNTHKNKIESLCGGSIISEEWVLTAAHCVIDTPYELTHLRFGDLDIDDKVREKAAPIDVGFSETIPHPNYSHRPKIINDIGLIRLKQKIKFQNELISPICLPGKAEFKEDTLYNKLMPFVAGWGFSDEIRQLRPTHLNFAQIKFTRFDLCKKKFENVSGTQIDGNVLCAGDYKRDACGGDSGGPLMVIRDDNFHIAGIVSYGLYCGKIHNITGVYTKVANYMDWVQNTTGLSF